jgi:spermidine synthase
VACVASASLAIQGGRKTARYAGHVLAMSLEVLRTITEGEKSLLLRRKGDVLDLVLGNVVLLSSAALETERAFGQLAKEPIVHAARETRVLIGGLGFGATLRGVLDVAREDTRIVVVEKMTTVVDIARREAAHLLGGALDDPRVELREDDVAAVLAAAEPGEYDAVLLDVDNGPGWASFRTNARLYADASLDRIKRALSPEGLFAVWSGYPADGFLRTIRKAGFVPRIEPLYERGIVRARAYLGSKPPDASSQVCRKTNT